MNFDQQIQDEFIERLNAVQLGITAWKEQRTEETRSALITTLLEARRYGSANASSLIGFPEREPTDPPAGPMVCRTCGRGIADDVNLYRVNKPGELPAIWDCQDHANLDAIDPVVLDITRTIEQG